MKKKIYCMFRKRYNFFLRLMKFIGSYIIIDLKLNLNSSWKLSYSYLKELWLKRLTFIIYKRLKKNELKITKWIKQIFGKR